MTDKAHIVCLELGGNIQSEIYLPRAAAELRKRFTVLGLSQVWETPPVGCTGCDNFLNAAVLIQTDLSPVKLKVILQEIEKELGRVRSADKFAPRTIDIDTLIYDGEVMDADIWDYAHLAVPVAELLPEIENCDTGDTVEEVAKGLAAKSPIALREEVLLV